MKKLLALALAAGLLLAVHTAPLAAASPATLTIDGAAQAAPAFQLNITPASAGTVYTQSLPVLYTYGPVLAGSSAATGGTQAKITVNPCKIAGDGSVAGKGYKITRLFARPKTGNVKASVMLYDGTLYGGGTAPVVTLKANTPANDCAAADYEVLLDMTIGTYNGKEVRGQKDITLTLKCAGGAAYSAARPVDEGETYLVNEQAGSVFVFDEPLEEAARVRSADAVVVLLQGNYGEQRANLRAVTDPVPGLAGKIGDGYAQYADFVGAPRFATPVRVRIQSAPETFVYEYGKGGEALRQVKTEFVNEAHEFETKELGCYVVTDVRL